MYMYVYTIHSTSIHGTSPLYIGNSLVEFIVLVFIVVYYTITITLCVHGKLKAKTVKHKTLIEEEEKPNSETKLQEIAQ